MNSSRNLLMRGNDRRHGVTGPTLPVVWHAHAELCAAAAADIHLVPAEFIVHRTTILRLLVASKHPEQLLLRILTRPAVLSPVSALACFAGLALVIHVQCNRLRKNERDLPARERQTMDLWRTFYSLLASAIFLSYAVGPLDWVGLLIVSRIVSLCFTRIIIDILGPDVAVLLEDPPEEPEYPPEDQKDERSHDECDSVDLFFEDHDSLSLPLSLSLSLSMSLSWTSSEVEDNETKNSNDTIN